MLDQRRLSRRKQDSLSGGNVNYYLVCIPQTQNHDEFDVEIEDIIEATDMNFALGTDFKSLVRLCKQRQDLGKPGSTPGYELGKIVYYSDRTRAITKRREDKVGFIGNLFRHIKHFIVKDYAENILDVTITIKDPKRLSPYSFIICEFIDALEPTNTERFVFRQIFRVALMRQRNTIKLPPHPSEMYHSDLLTHDAKYLKERLVG